MGLHAEPHFQDFVPEVLDGLEGTFTRSPTDVFDAPLVFGYWIAELFETTEPGAFVFTDGGRELGIDFYVHGDHSYYVYQCKTVEPETLLAATKPPMFGADAVNDLLEGIDFLNNTETNFQATKRSIKDLRTMYQRDKREVPDETHLYATLAVMGDLTPGGKDRFEAERLALANSGVTLRLITWREIYEQVHALEPMPLKGMKAQLHVDQQDRDILRQKDWFFALVYARDLVDAFDKYGVRLFDLNVRHEIRTSRVNKAIVATLKTASGRRDFHHFNNGLLVVCSNYRLPGSHEDFIQVNAPQVINGCQTVSSLARAYHDMVPDDQDAFRSTVKVQVKVMQNAKQDLVDEVVITTNNQNPMNPRNLKSNTREQRETQKAFRDLPGGRWFYVRKDGEFEALCQRGHEVQWFKKKDYEIEANGGRTRYRRVENEDVARAWYSWIGYSGRVLQGGVDYFDDDKVYGLVFQKRPNSEFWTQFNEASFDKADDDAFDLGQPTAHQYLLARAVASFIKESNPSPYKNKRDSIARLVRAGKITGDKETGEPKAPQAEVARALAEDRQFLTTGYFYNMENVLTELGAFLLTRRYGGLTPTTSRRLLGQDDVDLWCRHGFMLTPEQMESMKGPDSLLWRLYEFLKWAIQQNFFTEFKYQIEAAARPKMYFARRESIKEMKRVILESDELVRDGVFPWKKEQGISFVESLPELTQ